MIFQLVMIEHQNVFLNSCKGMNDGGFVWCLVKMAEPYWQLLASGRPPEKHFKSWIISRLELWMKTQNIYEIYFVRSFTEFQIDLMINVWLSYWSYIYLEFSKRAQWKIEFKLMAHILWAKSFSGGFCLRKTFRSYFIPTWIVEVYSTSPVNPELCSHWVCHGPRHHVQHLFNVEYCCFCPSWFPYFNTFKVPFAYIQKKQPLIA